MLQTTEVSYNLSQIPNDCHSLEYYDYISRIGVQQHFLSNEYDKKVNDFFDKLLEKKFGPLRDSFLVQTEKDKISFITVGHIVHHTPFFLRAVRSLGPIAAVIPKGESRKEYRDKLPFFKVCMQWYQHIMRNDINRSSINNFEKAKAFLKSVLPPGHRAVIIDEGGYFSPFVKALSLPENANDVFAKQCIAGIVEITKNGHFRWAKAFKKMTHNTVPIISIATSKIKEREDQEIGEAIIRNFDEILDRDSGTALRYQEVGVLGCGVIGTAVVKALFQRKLVNKIHLFDVVLESSLRASRLLQEKSFVIHHNKIDFLQSCNVIISATGSHGLTAEDFNQHIVNNVKIACVTSIDDEIAEGALKGFSNDCKINAEFTKSYVNGANKRVNLALDGNAVNFLSHSAVGPGIYQVLSSTLICGLRFFNQTNNYPSLSELNLITEEDMRGVIEIHEEFYGEHKSETETFGLYPSSRKFIGRRDELQRLRNILETKHSGVIGQSIAGYGGMGKTALAKRYAIQSFNERYYDFIFWVNANNEQTLYQDFVKIAQYFKINQEGKKPSEYIRLVYHELASFARVLIIFDDVPNYKILHEAWIGKEKVNFLPPVTKNLIHWVVTTLDKKFTEKSDEMIELGQFNSTDAIELIQSEFPNAEKIDANLLAKCLGYFPLALCQAIAYLQQNPSCTIRDYIQLYQNIELSGKIDLFQAEELAPHDHQRTVFKTWKLSMEFIKKKYPLSKNVFNIFAYFSSNQISIEIIQFLIIENPHVREDSFLDALECLARFSLIDVAPNKKSFNLHALVQAITVAHLASFSTKSLNTALNLLTHVVGNSKDLNLIIDHANQIIKHHENPLNGVFNQLCIEKIELLKQVAEHQHFSQLFSRKARDSYLLAKTICEREKLFNYLIPIQSGLANAYSGYGDLIMYVKSLDTLFQADELKPEFILHTLEFYDSTDEVWLKNAIRKILENMTLKTLATQLDISKFLTILNVPPEGIILFLFLPPDTNLNQLLLLANFNMESQNVSQILQFLLNPAFKAVRLNFLPDILMGLSLFQPAIVYCIFQGKFDKAVLFADQYYEKSKTSTHQPNQIASTYLYVLTHVLQNNIPEDAESLLHTMLEWESQRLDRFWHDQIHLLLSTIYAVKGEHEKSNKMMFDFLDNIGSSENTLNEEGLQRRIKTAGKFLLFHKENFKDSPYLFYHAFRILGRTFHVLKNQKNSEKIFFYAKTYFLNSLQNNPECVFTNLEYGFLLLRYGDFKAALPFFNKASLCDGQIYSFYPREISIVPRRIKQLFEQNPHQKQSFSLSFLSIYFSLTCLKRLGQNADPLLENLKESINEELDDAKLWKLMVKTNLKSSTFFLSPPIKAVSKGKNIDGTAYLLSKMSIFEDEKKELEETKINIHQEKNLLEPAQGFTEESIDESVGEVLPKSRNGNILC